MVCEAEKFKLKMTIAIVDSGSHLVSFARMDDSPIGAIDVSIKKAKTAAFYKIECKEYYSLKPKYCNRNAEPKGIAC